WSTDKLLNVIVQMGLTKLPDLPEVPSALDLVADVESRQVLELILIRQEAGRPFAAPPGVPADRLAALRRAFDATLADGEFRADADRRRWRWSRSRRPRSRRFWQRLTARRGRSCKRPPH